MRPPIIRWDLRRPTASLAIPPKATDDGNREKRFHVLLICLDPRLRGLGFIWLAQQSFRHDRGASRKYVSPRWSMEEGCQGTTDVSIRTRQNSRWATAEEILTVNTKFSLKNRWGRHGGAFFRLSIFLYF